MENRPIWIMQVYAQAMPRYITAKGKYWKLNPISTTTENGRIKKCFWNGWKESNWRLANQQCNEKVRLKEAIHVANRPRTIRVKHSFRNLFGNLDLTKSSRKEKWVETKKRWNSIIGYVCLFLKRHFHTNTRNYIIILLDLN